ncbi:MAG: hypothetical protein JXA21_08610 [Anaerolineae bacterium]|nr:hypothetical protein [Anaerolineae bacterium]
MRLKRHHFVLAIVLLVIAGLLIGALWTHPITRYRTQRAASRFYSSLITGDYARAFDNLAYYDRYSDLAPEISHAAAKTIWIERVDALREAQIYLVDMEGLEVHFDDGYPVGTARVVVMDRGEVITAVQRIHFVERAGVWKVQTVSTDQDQGVVAIARINKAISGLVKPLADASPEAIP